MPTCPVKRLFVAFSTTIFFALESHVYHEGTVTHAIVIKKIDINCAVLGHGTLIISIFNWSLKLTGQTKLNLRSAYEPHLLYRLSNVRKSRNCELIRGEGQILRDVCLLINSYHMTKTCSF